MYWVKRGVGIFTKTCESVYFYITLREQLYINRFSYDVTNSAILSEMSNDTCQKGLTLLMRDTEGYNVYKGHLLQYSVLQILNDICSS